jgi:hypothetical protein
MVRQVNGTYKVKHPNLKPLHAQVKALVARLQSFTIRHIPREENAAADRAAIAVTDEDDAVACENHLAILMENVGLAVVRIS